MSDIRRMMSRVCNTAGCENTGPLGNVAGTQVAYSSGDDMNADQRCGACCDAIRTELGRVHEWFSEDHETFRKAAKRVLSADVHTLRKV